MTEHWLADFTLSNSTAILRRVFRKKMSETEWKKCHLGAEKATIVIMAILPIIMIIATIFITHSFIKMNRSLDKKKSSMFKTTVLYFISTILLYISLTIKLIYECYGTYRSNDSLTTLTIGVFYGLHFLLLILLLFTRLKHVFETSTYALSKCSIYFFISLCVLGIIDGCIFFYFIINRHGNMVKISYVLGTLLILIATIWVISIYIYKLFTVIRNSQRHRLPAFSRSVSSRTSSSKPSTSTKAKSAAESADTLLPTISKYTVTAMFCILSSVLFWIVAIAVPSDGGFPRLFSYHFCLFIDVTVNLVCFVLGYGYTNKVYYKYCGCIDKCCRILCGRLVLISLCHKIEHDQPDKDVVKSQSSKNGTHLDVKLPLENIESVSRASDNSQDRDGHNPISPSSTSTAIPKEQKEQIAKDGLVMV